MASLFSALFLAAIVASPLISAITLSTPTGWYRGASVEETWTSAPADPTSFDLVLVNPDDGVTKFKLSSDVPTSAEQVRFNVPANVPVADNYTMQAVNVTNWGQVYQQSGTFWVA